MRGLAAFSVLIVLGHFPSAVFPEVAAQEQTRDWKVENALSAAPEYIAGGAAVWDWPATAGAEPSVLREGTNGWTCFPSPTDAAGNSPRCYDDVFLEVNSARLRGEDANIDAVGFGYMLQGGPFVDDQGTQTLGPHVMMVLPDDQSLTQGIGQAEAPDGPFMVDSFIPGADLIIMPLAAGSESIEIVPGHR